MRCREEEWLVIGAIRCARGYARKVEADGERYEVDLKVSFDVI